jgi:peptidoglycan/LPS O-acetylase OafA/YrhL
VDKSFKINNFDLLRILAATQVVGVHIFRHMNIVAPGWWPVIESFPGVPIFFVISGFLISASYERSSSLRSYARNRVLRIYPALWCCVLLTIPIAIFFGMNLLNWQAPVWLVSQLVGVIYTPHFLHDFGFGSYNGSLWTIPIELQFYIVLPLMYLFVRRTRNATAGFWLIWVAFIAAAVVLRWMLPLMGDDREPQTEKLVRYSFFPHIYLFLTGLMLQRLKAQQRKWITGKGPYWIAAYLVLVYLFRHFPPASQAVNAVSYVSCMLILAIATVAMAYTTPGVSHTILRGNDISYGVYIYHGLILNVLIELGLSGQIQYALLLILGAFIAGYLSWIGIERPFLRRKRQTISPDIVLGPVTDGPR